VSGVWLVSYIILWVLVALLVFAVVVLLRQIGVLHARLAPMGTHFAGEGLDVGVVAPNLGFDYGRSVLTVIAFTSPTCQICAALKPSLVALRRQYPELVLELVDASQSPATFDAFKVRSTPYVMTINREGRVVGRGVANTLEQIEQLVSESLASNSASAANATKLEPSLLPENAR
jgi:thiol-disulfide isomerase/thioredoxin